MINMIILQDKGQKKDKHVEKNQAWQKSGIQILDVPLPCGDYILGTEKVMDVISRKDKRGIPAKKMDFLGSYKATVDTKQSVLELVNNICGKQHARFRDECILAQNNGIKLYILVENLDGITCLDNLHEWKNPRAKIMTNGTRVIGRWKNGKPRYERVPRFPKATTGEVLMKACKTMSEKYGVEFLFTRPEMSAGYVVELLKRGEEDG